MLNYRKTRRNTLRSERAMTLVEIIVVIVLITLVAGVVIKGVFGKGEEAKARVNILKMDKLVASLQQYRLEYNQYPSALDDLIKPSNSAKESGKLFMPLAKNEDMLDVWGFPYTYEATNSNRSFKLTTLGADGIAGGEGAKQDVVKTP